MNERVVAPLGSTTLSLMCPGEAGVFYSLLRDCVSRPPELVRRGSASPFSLFVLSLFRTHHALATQYSPSDGRCVHSPPLLVAVECVCAVAALVLTVAVRCVLGGSPCHQPSLARICRPA